MEDERREEDAGVGCREGLWYQSSSGLLIQPWRSVKTVFEGMEPEDIIYATSAGSRGCVFTRGERVSWAPFGPGDPRRR